MTWLWICGYLVAVISIWIGVSKGFKGLKISTKQLFAVIGVFVLIVMIGLTLDDLFHWWSKFPRTLLGIAGVLIVLDRIARIFLARRRGGKQLMDLGMIPAPEMIINVFAGLGLAWFAVSDVVKIMHAGIWTFHDISFQILGASIAFAVLVQGLGRRRILEHGVFHGTGFTGWEKIESYSWEKESTTSSVLVLHKRVAMPFFKLETLSVKLEQAEEAEEILRQHNIHKVGDTVKSEG